MMALGGLYSLSTNLKQREEKKSSAQPALDPPSDPHVPAYGGERKVLYSRYILYLIRIGTNDVSLSLSLSLYR